MLLDEAQDLTAVWGGDLVHPAPSAYHIIAEMVFKDISDPQARYSNFSNQAKMGPPAGKRNKVDLSLRRDGWVSSCTAALQRRNSAVHTNSGAQPIAKTFMRFQHPRGLRSGKR
jgi:hypothetical protein